MSDDSAYERPAATDDVEETAHEPAQQRPTDAERVSSDPDAPGTGAAAEEWPDDPAEPNEPG